MVYSIIHNFVLYAFKVANAFDCYHLKGRDYPSNSPQIHHRNLTILTAHEIFKIASHPFGSLVVFGQF